MQLCGLNPVCWHHASGMPSRSWTAEMSASPAIAGIFMAQFKPYRKPFRSAELGPVLNWGIRKSVEA